MSLPTQKEENRNGKAREAAKNKWSRSFVTKINATGTALVYSTYLGGSGDDFGDDSTSNSLFSDGRAFLIWSHALPSLASVRGCHWGHALATGKIWSSLWKVFLVINLAKWQSSWTASPCSSTLQSSNLTVRPQIQQCRIGRSGVV
jgi:hypothetical protein